MPKYVIGVDVGGTYTDAVIIDVISKRLLAHAKIPGTEPVATGIVDAIQLRF